MRYSQSGLELVMVGYFFFFKQKTAYEMRISDWSSDVCSSDLEDRADDRAACPPQPVDRHTQAAMVVAAPFDHQQRHLRLARQQAGEIGRASCRERVCQYV